MKTLWIVLLLAVTLGPLWAEEDSDPFLSAPMSSKIWDDYSLANLSSKGHKALGYATMTLGLTTLTLAAVHQPVPLLADMSAVAAGLTVAAGITAHWDRLSFEGDLATWHNLHAATAAVGASVVAASPFLGPRDRPSPWLAVGTGLLVLAVIFEG